MNLLLIDTNVLIDALKKKRGRAEYLESLPLHGFTLALCAVVVAELYTGLLQADIHKADGMTRDFVFLATNVQLARMAGVMRRRYRDRDISLSIPDCLIAAAAIHYDVMLVTDNQKDFPMPELRFYPLPAVH
jgi:predicted nucleic acid-binding protein